MSAYLILAEAKDGRKMIINPINIVTTNTLISKYDTKNGFFDWLDSIGYRMLQYSKRESHTSYATSIEAINCLVRTQNEYYKFFSYVKEGNCKFKIISYQNGIKLLSKLPSRIEKLRNLKELRRNPEELCNKGFGDYVRDARYSKHMNRKLNKQKARKGKFR